MAFGHNRYVLFLAASAAALGLTLTAGCSDSSSSRSFMGSTVAPATSGIAPTTSGTNTTVAPMLTRAELMDVDQSNHASKGDKIVLTFDGEVAPVASNANVTVSSEFTLAVAGDDFGANASVGNGPTSRDLEIILGDAPILHVSTAFVSSSVTPGSASGINMAFGTGQLTGLNSGSLRSAATPVDIESTLTAGFFAAPSLNEARGGHVSVLLNDGRVLVVGGIAGGSSDSYVAKAEVFDPVANTFTVVGEMKRDGESVRMVGATATKLQDGTVLICGGYGVEKSTRKFLFFGPKKAKVDTLKSAFIFDPANDSFTRVGDLGESRKDHSATLLRDGRVLITGGYNDSVWKKHKTQAAFEIYDPQTKTFTKDSGTLGIGGFKSKESRMAHTATAIEGGNGVLLTGGNHYEGGWLFGAFKPKLKMNKGSEVVRDANKTTSAGDLNDPRMHHAAAGLAGDKVLVAGGQNAQAVVGSLELFDPATGQWTNAGSLSAARTSCAVTTDAFKGNALIVGGHDGNGESNAVDAFDAATGTVTSQGTLATPRNGCTVETLNDGRVLVIGGLTGGVTSLQSLDGQALASCEAYVKP